MKKLIFSLIATVFMSVLSVNAQVFKDFRPIDIGLGKVSSYAGPCVEGGAVCTDNPGIPGTDFRTGIRITDSSVTFAFDKEFYQRNIEFLKDGLFIEKNFSLPKKVSESFGIKGEFIVKGKATYQFTVSDGYYFVTLPRVK